MSGFPQHSMYYRRRSDPEPYREPRDYQGGERYGRRPEPRNYNSMGGGGHGYGQNGGYGGMYSKDGYGHGQQGMGRGHGRGHGGGVWGNGRVDGRPPGHHGYSRDVGGYSRHGSHRDNYYSGGYREPHRGEMSRGGCGDGGPARGRGGGRGRGGRGAGQGRERESRKSVKFNCVVKIENLPFEMNMKELRNILLDLGFDRRLYIDKVLEEEEHKIAIVQIVEEGQDCINRMDELQINGQPIVSRILGEKEISELQLDVEAPPAPTKPYSPGFIVNLEFFKFDSIPSQTEIEEKIRRAGLESPKKWKTIGARGFSMIIVGQGDQREEIKTALNNLDFGEDTSIVVKDVKRNGMNGMMVKVSQVDPSVEITNLPKDCDSKKIKAAIKKVLQFNVCVEDCKEGSAMVSYSPRLIEFAKKIDGLKIGDNVVEVVGKKKEEEKILSIPDDCSEDKLKEVLGVGSLVPVEIRAEDDNLVMVFKPIKENLPQILQELSKIAVKEGKDMKEEKVEAIVEDLKEEELKESSEDVEVEKKEAVKDPMMIDGKPVMFACTDIREKQKAEALAKAQAEQAELETIDTKAEEGNQS